MLYLCQNCTQSICDYCHRDSYKNCTFTVCQHQPPSLKGIASYLIFKFICNLDQFTSSRTTSHHQYVYAPRSEFVCVEQLVLPVFPKTVAKYYGTTASRWKVPLWLCACRKECRTTVWNVRTSIPVGEWRYWIIHTWQPSWIIHELDFLNWGTLPQL